MNLSRLFLYDGSGHARIGSPCLESLGVRKPAIALPGAFQRGTSAGGWQLNFHFAVQEESQAHVFCLLDSSLRDQGDNIAFEEAAAACSARKHFLL